MTNSHCRWPTLGLLAIVLLAGACGGAQPGSVPPQGDATHGQSLWAQSACAGCHGTSAQGSASGPALANTPLSSRDVTSIVRRGGPGMPKYLAAQVSDQDLQDLYAWLQNPVPPAAGGQGQNPWVQAGCAACHGANAEGGSGPRLAGEQISFTKLQRVVRRGEEEMPAYSTSQISDSDLQGLYEWLQALP